MQKALVFRSKVVEDVPKVTKGKTVRIISPHYSRAKEDYGISAIHSPPLQGFSASPSADDDPSPSEEPSPIDPFDVQSDEGIPQLDDEDLYRSTIANAAALGASPVPLNMSMPVKPAARAPALRFGGNASALELRSQAGFSSAAATANRPHYDVDDFTRLLLTGEKLLTETNTRNFTPPAHEQVFQLADSNSNTDASSVSRQSIFEPHPEAHPESPSTSMDVPLSDEERHGLVQSPPAIGRSRPSVPPSHQRKLVKQHVPQTVLFDSMSSSPPGGNLQPTPSAEASPLATLNISRHLNKPLPPPPRAEPAAAMEPGPDLRSDAVGVADVSLAPPKHLGRVASKRSPPPLPAARRQAQADGFQASPVSTSFTHTVNNIDKAHVTHIIEFSLLRASATSTT
ncbi:MAG: hypothetical protein Q9208_003629 [Pyrenodesmia sp. 3 TL-2023]